jgi:hypothetical protein
VQMSLEFRPPISFDVAACKTIEGFWSGDYVWFVITGSDCCCSSVVHTDLLPHSSLVRFRYTLLLSAALLCSAGSDCGDLERAFVSQEDAPIRIEMRMAKAMQS